VKSAQVQAQDIGALIGASVTVPKLTSICGDLELQHGLGMITHSVRWLTTVRVTVPRPSSFRYESHESPDEDEDVDVDVDSQAAKMTVNAKTKRNIIRQW